MDASWGRRIQSEVAREVLGMPLQTVLAAAACALLIACTNGTSGIRPRGIAVDALPIPLERFMGDWYVVAHIPTYVEDEAYGAVETYALRDDGAIDVRFRFCDGSFDGPRREIAMLGWVQDPTTNAEWRVRPFWPLRLSYQILELDPAFSVTVVGHPSGRYAWVMARRPELREDELDDIIRRLSELGYRTERMRRVPQRDGACLK